MYPKSNAHHVVLADCCDWAVYHARTALAALRVVPKESASDITL